MSHFLQLLLAVQAAQATVTGAVRTADTGEPLAGAVVALPELGRTVSTDPAGRYVLSEVPPGPQHLEVRFIGHTPHALHALVPASGRLEINVALRPEPFRLRTIQVLSPPDFANLEQEGEGAAPADRQASAAAMRNHPLLAEPDAFQVLGGGEVGIRPESPGGVHVRGGASDQTAFLLDGFPVFSPYHAAGLFSAWNPDALSGVRLSSSFPAPGDPHALSGVVSGATREPGDHLGVQGSMSTAQARLTVDGPIGRSGAGYLLSFRTAFPGVPFPQRDPSYLGAETGDRLAKLELPALGGRLRLLAYDSENEIDAAASAEAGDEGPRHTFEWAGGSAGVGWRRSFPGLDLEVSAWSAEANAGARWEAPSGGVRLASNRHDLGLAAMGEWGDGRRRTAAGFRLERSRTSYTIASAHPAALAGVTPVLTVMGQHTRPLGRRTELTVGGSVSAADGGIHPAPRARVGWKPTEKLELSAGYARTLQFAQSLRNGESVVGNVFPADLFVGSRTPGVPTARNDQGTLAAEYLPAGGMRLAMAAYRRESRGLVLAAPRGGTPFSTGAFAVGSGAVWGLSLDGALRTARVGVLASYGLQHVRLRYEGSDYVPEYGTAHLLDGGVIAFPTATFSVRIGASAALGRRATAAAGGLEWEACNLLDRGCEFSGTPVHDGEPLGAVTLPAYLRVDLGVRKHWHFRVGGRDALVAVFGTVTNLLNRGNILTYARDPATGEPAPVEMRPLAPLLVGIDWRY